MHGHGNIYCQHPGSRITREKLACAVACATARIDNDVWFVLYVIEPRQHPIAHLPLQDGGLVIARSGSLEGRAQAPFIDDMVVIHRQIALSSKQTALDRKEKVRVRTGAAFQAPSVEVDRSSISLHRDV